MECPLCRSSDLEHFAKRTGVPVLQNVSFINQEDARNIKKGDIDLVSCKNCSFVFNASFEDVVYTETYENDQSFSACFKEHTKYITEKVSKFINSLSGSVKIIEIGCGQGGFLKNVVSQIDPNRNYQAIGFDPACRAKKDDIESNIRFVPEYFSQQHLEGEAYDHIIIIARHVIEHIFRIDTLLSELARTNVQEGGSTYLFLETPDFDWILKNVRFEDLVYEHCSLFNPDSMRYLLAQYNCEFLKIEKVFQDQYMWVEAKVALEKRTCFISNYQEQERHFINKWKDFLSTAYREHSNVYVWGAGAKGVAFANLLDPDMKYIHAVVDINPKKSGKFLSGTGHKIISPEECVKHMPEKIIVMNKNYFIEIQSYLMGETENCNDLQLVSI